MFFVLVVGIVLASCAEADKKAEDATASNTSQSKIDSLNAISNAANHPHSEQAPVDTANLTTIEWLDGASKDFGKIKDGENLDVVFRFKNTGTKPLVISRVWAQCGCTVAETPQKPYAPGETGEIKASFNSSGKVGANSKDVYMMANTNPSTSTLTFKVEVKQKS